jgi:uncharacterized spore protein YtfJ
MSMEMVLSNFVERFAVKAVYGEPVTSGDVTVIPVAKIAFGFGGGQGTGNLKDESGPAGEGSGGGGGGVAKPEGYIEVTPMGSRYVPIHDKRRIAGALALGVLIGVLLARRRA